MEPLISIIVPVYNVELYIDECINSIVNQTYKNLEIILVNDGSVDSSGIKCDLWSKKDNRIKVIHKQNGGLSSARNAGLNIVTGDYIGFVDSDDYLDHTMYEKLYNALKNAIVNISCCYSYKLYDNGKLEDKYKHKFNETFNFEDAIINVFLGKAIGQAVWNKLYKRSIFDNIRFPEGENNEDLPLLIPTIFLSNGVSVVNEALYYYRKRAGSITSSGFIKKSQIIYKHLKLVENQVVNYGLSCKKELKIFMSNYSHDMVMIMQKNQKELCHEDKMYYEKFYTIMKNNFMIYVLSKHVSYKRKLIHILLLSNKYVLLHNMLKKSKKVYLGSKNEYIKKSN